MNRMLLLPFLTVLRIATIPTVHAQDAGHSQHAFAGGNALLTAKTIQEATKQLIIGNLQKNINARNGANGIVIETEESEHHLSIPESAVLNDILKALGIRNELKIKLDPIRTSINFGSDSLKISVERTDINHFRIRTHWQIPQIVAKSTSLKIQVPKGTFDRAFSIVSSPVKISLDRRSGPLTADLDLDAVLTPEGSLFKLISFRTNLDDHRSRLRMQLGQLTVGGRPMSLEILTNGRTIRTDEPTIRNELRKFEPQLMTIVESKLADLIRSEFKQIAQKLEKEEPFKINFNSTDILKRYPSASPALQDLLKDITGDFMFSFIQEIPRLGIYSTQASTRLCIGNTCVYNKSKTSPITTVDIESMGQDNAGIILYESWVQNIVNSDPFQKRIRKYFKQTVDSPGIDLAKNGIRIHFNPLRNSITAVVNLRIDIKATCDAATKWDSWSAFREFSRKRIADWWEQIAGSGDYVIVPVEINFSIKGTQLSSDGKQVIRIVPELPFGKTGKIRNTYHYPTNIHLMNASIREELLEAVRDEFQKPLPKEILISISEPIQFRGINFFINHGTVTPNGGLLISGSIQ